MKENAGLTSKIEAMQRMAEGEVFYGGGAVFQCEEGDLGAMRFTISKGGDDIKGLWDVLTSWSIEIPDPEWYEDLNNKAVLCYAWDRDTKPEFPSIGYVHSFVKGDTYPYKTQDGDYFKHAEPITELPLTVSTGGC